jgi:hypothetical protein
MAVVHHRVGRFHVPRETLRIKQTRGLTVVSQLLSNARQPHWTPGEPDCQTLIISGSGGT